MSYKNIKVYSTNAKATIRSRFDRNGNTRTETTGRDSGIDVALVTNKRGTTELFIDGAGRDYGFSPEAEVPATLRLDGHQARTLYRALGRHFDVTGKSTQAW